MKKIDYLFYSSRSEEYPSHLDKEAINNIFLQEAKKIVADLIAKNTNAKKEYRGLYFNSKLKIIGFIKLKENASEENYAQYVTKFDNENLSLDEVRACVNEVLQGGVNTQDIEQRLESSLNQKLEQKLEGYIKSTEVEREYLKKSEIDSANLVFRQDINSFITQVEARNIFTPKDLVYQKNYIDQNLLTKDEANMKFMTTSFANQSFRKSNESLTTTGYDLRYLKKNETAINSDMLGNKQSSEFVLKSELNSLLDLSDYLRSDAKASDSALFNGLEVGKFLLKDSVGLGKDSQPTLANLDDFNIKAGFYKTNATTSGTFASDSKYGQVVVLRHDSNWITQIWTSLNGSEVYFRGNNLNSGAKSWRAWEKCLRWSESSPTLGNHTIVRRSDTGDFEGRWLISRHFLMKTTAQDRLMDKNSEICFRARQENEEDLKHIRFATMPKLLEMLGENVEKQLGSNGSINLVGGMVLKWGQGNGSRVVFPVAFPNACLCVACNEEVTRREAGYFEVLGRSSGSISYLAIGF